MKRSKFFIETLLIAFVAAAGAINYAIFIFPNQFAPAGIDGLCTMVQYLSGISIGYLSLVVNIPLLIIAYIKLDREFAIKSTVFSLSFSAVSAILSELDLSAFLYQTDHTSIVLAPIAAGVIRGIIYALTIKANGSSGGLDIIAALIRKKSPHFNLMNVIFTLNMIVVIISCFVYDYQLEPVICGILYFYIVSQTSSHIQLSGKENVKIEVITTDAAALCVDITEKLHLRATVLDSYGAYSGNANKMVVCIAPKKSVPFIKDAIGQYPDAIYFESTVTESNMKLY